MRKWGSSAKFLAPSAEGVAEASDQTKEEPNGNWDSLFRRESSDSRWYCKTIGLRSTAEGAKNFVELSHFLKAHGMSLRNETVP